MTCRANRKKRLTVLYIVEHPNQEGDTCIDWTSQYCWTNGWNCLWRGHSVYGNRPLIPLTLNVEHTVKTKVLALRQLLQWSEYPAVVLLQDTGILPPRFVFHCLYWHTFTVVSSSSAGVAILVRRDSQLHIGDFVHHPEGRAIVLELVYKGTPVQVVNLYMSAKGTAKEYHPLLQWLRAHVAPDSQLVLMGGDFQCNPGWSADCVSVNTEIAPVLCEVAADMTLLLFTHGMFGPTWVSARGFVGALDFFLSRRFSLEIGTVRVENESVFPSDHYPVRLCLHTLPALVPPRNPASRARFNLGTSVCQWQQETFADSCTGLRSLPLAATPEAYRHFVSVLTTAAEAVFGPPSTPDTCNRHNPAMRV